MKADDVTLKDVIFEIKIWFNLLLNKWRLLLCAGIIGGILGFAYSYLKKTVYVAECTFVLEEGGGAGGGLGQYAGLASMVGIDVGGGSNGIFDGDNIMELYKSRTMIQKTLLTPADLNGRTDLLINHFIENNALREKWKNTADLSAIQFSLLRKDLTVKHDSIIGEIVKNVRKDYLSISKPDRKLNIISVKVRAKDQYFAQAFAEKIVDNVNAFYVQTRTKKALDNVLLLEKQADSVRRVLNASIGGAANASDANPNANPALQILRVPSQRKQIDVQASSAIYTEVVKNLEIARIGLRKETPLIQVIDKPVLPLEEEKVGKMAGISFGAIIFTFLTAVFLILNRIYQKIVE